MLLNILFFTTAFLFAFTTPVLAHDCWVQPDTFRLGLSSLFFARIFVGHRGKRQKELPMEKEMIRRADLFAGNKQINLLPTAVEGQIPAVEHRVDFTGHGLLVLNRDFTDITIESEKFTSYLEHEHQEEALALRKEQGGEAAQKERYARCMKALFQVEEDSLRPLHDVIVGQRLEILLHKDPYQCRLGDDIEVTVLFENRPLADKWVTAYRCAADQEALSEQVEKTDAQGRAFFTLNGSGLWMIRLVHIYPVEDGMDWESYWSAYCFEIQG
jgi:uncharacterized GH25 family protein